MSCGVPEEVLVRVANVFRERVSLQVQREVPVGHRVGVGAFGRVQSGNERRADRRDGQREVEVAVRQMAPDARDGLVVDNHSRERLLQECNVHILYSLQRISPVGKYGHKSVQNDVLYKDYFKLESKCKMYVVIQLRGSTVGLGRVGADARDELFEQIWRAERSGANCGDAIELQRIVKHAAE